MANIDLKKYSEFVEAVTSKESNEMSSVIDRMYQIFYTYPNVNLSLLMTAGIGLASETGEFDEILKKCMFQGKELTEDTQWHMKRELGDIMWYWLSACRALDIDPNEVIAENVKKLGDRYPGGEFDVWHSENRKEGDL